MKLDSTIVKWLGGTLAITLLSTAQAGSPLWTFTPLTATTLTLPSGSTATVQYIVTNQSSKTHTLMMQPIEAVTQLTAGVGVCASPFILAGKASCTLSLQIDGNQLTQSIINGPIICERGSALQCYRPSTVNLLNITQAQPVLNATISASNSPLTLTTNGMNTILYIYNSSNTVTALNITSDFTGTALDGNVTETGNTCGNLAPNSICELTFTPGNTVVPQTTFSIQGSNTNTTTAAIEVDAGVTLSNVNPASGSASGGTGVTLTGVGLTGATSVTFSGVAATSVNVINSTTVTAVTPAFSAGSVDVVITTPSGNSTLVNGYTYLATSVGQSTHGGIIACLNGGSNNLIASATDVSSSMEAGGSGVSTSATSTTDGVTNTALTVTTLGANGGIPYAAQLCDQYEADSQGNTPCQAGNTCYNDWFLPAGNNVTVSGQLNCLYTNRILIGGFANATYWSSTEANATSAWIQDFSIGAQNNANKSTTQHVRCVRAFTP